jgi:hypothetical protein
MLPIALSRPMTRYKRSMTSAPMNWLLDPAPVTGVRSNGASTFVAPNQSAAGESGLGLNGAMRFVYRPDGGGSQPNANDFYLDVAISEESGLSVVAESGRPTEQEPAKAIATNPSAMIKPRMAFALSQRSNSR